MFQQTRAPLRAGRIAEPAAIRAIASPVRQELVDTLEALGGVATVAELAEQLGRPADGLYYHVEILRRAGLFVAAPLGRSDTGRSERRYRTPTRPGTQLALVYRPRDARNAAAVRAVVGGMLRIARRDFDRALAPAASCGRRAPPAGSATPSSPRSTACSSAWPASCAGPAAAPASA